jgi:hypothetical protein
MMNGMGSMMTGMGLVWFLLIVAVVSLIAAVVKYLFFPRDRKDR